MVVFPDEFATCTGFDWDAGNAGKNWERHQVTPRESEQVFFERPIIIAPDLEHSQIEPRYAALGKTAAGKRLTIVLTIRETRIRVISARTMSRSERGMYERA